MSTKRLTPETRRDMMVAFLNNPSLRIKDLAEKYSVSEQTAGRAASQVITMGETNRKQLIRLHRLDEMEAGGFYQARLPSASAPASVRSEANERRREAEEEANKSRTNSEDGKHQASTQIEFKP